MLKRIIPIIIIAAIAALFFIQWRNNTPSSIAEPYDHFAEQEHAAPTNIAQITITYGPSKQDAQPVILDSTETAYSLLTYVSERNGFDVTVTHYDFGVFVEAIGDYENSDEAAWIYYVNGESGTIAADQYMVQNGDKIEWKYEKPEY